MVTNNAVLKIWVYKLLLFATLYTTASDSIYRYRIGIVLAYESLTSEMIYR